MRIKFCHQVHVILPNLPYVSSGQHEVYIRPQHGELQDSREGQERSPAPLPSILLLPLTSPHSPHTHLAIYALLFVQARRPIGSWTTKGVSATSSATSSAT